MQPLDQPVKTENSPAVALSVTGEPAVKPCVQSVLQLMPAGELVTVPPPVPVVTTESWYVFSVNVAVTVVSALTRI